MPKLTKTYVDSLQPKPEEYTEWDSELHGFGVRVQTTGVRTYMVRYRLQNGVQRKQKISRSTDMPPDRARDMARKVFASVAEGVDPKEERTKARNGDTMNDLWDRYLREHATPFKKASSVSSDKQNWRIHAKPALGSKRAINVTQSDILVIKGSLSTKTGAANQCIALLSKMFNLAEMWKAIPPGSNPCRGIKKYKIKEKELILSHPQIAALDQTMDTMVGDGRVRPEFSAFIRLLMITGCRKCEIMLARRSWIDEERSLLLLPDSKVGQRKIPLSPAALEIVAKLGQGEWLIPGRTNGQPLKTPYKVWMAIKREASLPLELRLHDLRHTAGSLAHMAGMTQLEVAQLLGHKQLSTTERYLHGHAGSSARVANTVSDVITGSWSKPALNATA